MTENPYPFLSQCPDYYRTLVSPPFLLLVCGIYLSLTYIGRELMKNRERFDDLGKFPIFYNAFQVLLSLYMSWGIFGPRGLMYSYLLGINNPLTYELEYFVWVHYWSKMVDFVDTLMIILKKSERQLNFLHIYHHASIVVIWGLLLYYGVGNGTSAFGAGLNSVIHAIMYTHYLFSSLGVTNPFKRYVTTAQLVQFVLCIMHSVGVYLFEKSIIQPWWKLQFIYQLSMVYLFMGFYNRTYKENEIDTNNRHNNNNNLKMSDQNGNNEAKKKVLQRKKN